MLYLLGNSKIFIMKKLFLLFCLFLSLTTLFAQSGIKVNGVIRDNANQPIPGVRIDVKKAKISAVTDSDGRYIIQVPADGKLVFSLTGYESKKIAVKNHSAIDVMLEKSPISELVVVGYGVQKKESVTGSITNIQGKDINRSQDLVNSLSKATGVQIYK